MLRVKETSIKNDYKFIKEIGRGASGICYEVVSIANNKKRCAKQIRSDGDAIPQEIQILGTLSHPGIIRVHEIYKNYDSLFIITDLCEGGDLYDFLEKRGAFSEADAKEIFMQLIKPLTYCHQMKICHRDLKPQNFLLLQKVPKNSIPRIKMIDFDLAFRWNQDMAKQVIAKQGKSIKGTPYYIAPQILEGNYNEKCDIWSAGVILHILLSGRAPFDGSNEKQIMRQIKIGKLNLQISEFEDVSLLVKDLIKKMLTRQDKRITLSQIYEHPWMKIKPRNTKFKVDFGCIVKYSKFGKLKQIVAGYLASQMTASELTKIQPLFQTLDVNHDGFISTQELQEGIKQLNGKQQIKELENLLNFVELNGFINFNQFVASFIKQKVITCEKNLKKVFDMIDYDGNGFIDSLELKELLQKIGAKKKPLRQVRVSEETKNIFTLADKNNDGKIDFSQFKQTVIDGVQF